MHDKKEIPAIVNEKISDLVHDFMNFNALKIIKKFIKKLEKGRICGQMLDVSTDKGQLT